LIQLSLGKMLQSGSSQIASMIRTMRTGLRKKVDSEMKIRERKKVIQKHIERVEKQTEIAPDPKVKKQEKKKEEASTAVMETIAAPSSILPKQDEAPVQLDFRDMSENFILPPLTLLESPSTESTVDKKELVEKSKVITSKLAEFSISGSVTEIHPGPVVTTFEF